MNAFVSLVAAVAAVFGLWLLVSLPGSFDPSRRPWSSTLPVLGGSEPVTHAWSRFHLRYYPMTLLLVAFEMEMMFMYPWAVVYVQEGLTALAEMGMFLAILSVGVLYAWREGVFQWQ